MLKNTFFSALIFTFLSILPQSAFAANVLILDDGWGNEVHDALVSEGHTVTSVLYTDWDGTNPSLAGIDFLLWLQGYEYGGELGDAANSPLYDTIINFVEAGGVFAANEWIGYNMCSSGEQLALLPIMPFTCAGYDGYNYDGTYTVTNPLDPLVAGVPLNWNTQANADGGVCTSLDPSAISPLQRNMDYYLPDAESCQDAYGLAYIPRGAGVSIHFNSDLGHNDDENASAEQLQLIKNMVEFNVSGAPANNIPTMSVYGLVITMLCLLFVAMRRLRVSTKHG